MQDSRVSYTYCICSNGEDTCPASLYLCNHSSTILKSYNLAVAGDHIYMQKEMMVPAVKGTKNVLEACSASGVQKLVMVSSIGAVCFTRAGLKTG